MSFRDWPMERKFLVSTLTITLTSIALISLVLILSEQRTVRGERLANSETLVGMIANNAAAALVFDDEKTARQLLAGASAEPSTRAAALYDATGALYAWYPADLPAASFPTSAGPERAVFSGDHLDVYAPVLVGEKLVGRAFLRTDLMAMRQRFRWYTTTVVIASAIAVALAVLLSRAVQRWISEPLVSLSRAAKAIADSGSYSIRARKDSADEVGELVDAFNRMVQEVESSHQEIQAHAANLEKEVANRTAALRETVNELEAFSYTVSHDLRAPLRAIENYSGILLETADQRDPESREYLRRIIRATTRMNQLIRDILSYSRVAKAEMRNEVVDLDGILHSVLIENPQFVAPPISIEVRKPLGKVMGHEAAVAQVFANLIGNAVKFVPADRTARVEIWAQDGGGVRTVYVRDNGVGIAEAHQPRLFRLFERLPNGLSYEGTGVGLSIVKKTVERMNGRVGVTSRPGEGSTFWFELAEGGRRE